MIPDLDPETGLLPYLTSPAQSTFVCSVDEIFERFAVSELRRHHEERFRCWLEDLDRAGMPGRLYFSGSYLTEKESPSDVDVLVVFGQEDGAVAKEALLATPSLWTWQEVQAAAPRKVMLDRLRPFGGFVDAHYTIDLPARMAQWETDWTTERDESGQPTGVRKGWLEVAR